MEMVRFVWLHIATDDRAMQCLPAFIRHVQACAAYPEQQTSLTGNPYSHVALIRQQRDAAVDTRKYVSVWDIGACADDEVYC